MLEVSLFGVINININKKKIGWIQTQPSLKGNSNNKNLVTCILQIGFAQEYLNDWNKNESNIYINAIPSKRVQWSPPFKQIILSLAAGYKVLLEFQENIWPPGQ